MGDSGDQDRPRVVDLIDVTTERWHDGTATATFPDGDVRGMFSGAVALYDGTSMVARCEATDHTMHFERW